MVARWVPNNFPIENLVFSAGGGFLYGAAAGYTIKKSSSWSLLFIIQRMDKRKMDRNGKCIKGSIDKRNKSGFSCIK